ncbi:MAG: glycosyltransferase [Bacteroidales bacterium]|nr:glycosyltransferase [Bacteroidales bacterium]
MNRFNLKERSFQESLIRDLNTFLKEQEKRFPADEVLKMDMHCHDHNSDVPDELLGRILKVPETWLKTSDLLKTLKQNGCDAITITNHNNARSCFELLHSGKDVLTASEFSCTVPDFNIGIHVLTYGFSEEQEKELNKLRRNVYAFLQFARENDIPTIWAHPLYYYSREGIPPIGFFNKMALVFERFETLNGQRDTWQNMLVKEWIKRLDKETIDRYAEQFDIDPTVYCRDPYKKSLSGGSDSHMGIFSGLTGTYLHVPDLKIRRKKEPLSQLALEAIRSGRMAPYGAHQTSEKLTIAFLDYVFQIAMNRKDPGLMRILLHKGTVQDKMIAMAVSNAFAEVQRHKVTMNFIGLFHHCFMGKSPVFTKRWFIPKVYKPVFDDAGSIASSRNNGSKNLVEDFNRAIDSISQKLNDILYSRLSKKIENLRLGGQFDKISLPNIIEHFEMPSELRLYFEKGDNQSQVLPGKKLNIPDIPQFLDGLSFPFLASSLILAANFTSARVLYNARPLLDNFAESLGKYKHPRRMLWLTDTFDDSNGVSFVLKAMHDEIKLRDLPIDIVVCSESIKPDDHLIVMKPLAEYQVPFYKQQPLRIPDMLKIHRLFHEGEYDRIICSTEGPMGLAALYLKQAFSIPAYFFIHTDWIMFARKVLEMDADNISRFRRLLRAFYHNFDGLFVLNSDQQRWLMGRHMGFAKKQVHLTAHWADQIFYRRATTKTEAFNLPVESKVILFAGRLSKEKGVLELPEIMTKVKSQHPDVKLVIAGSGPAEAELKASLPDATFLGWVDHNELPVIYSAANLLILPSKFDTFSVVVLEALSCGLPVVAYKTKGPKDIIQHNESGYVVSTKEEMIKSVIRFFVENNIESSFRNSALNRAKDFQKELILSDFLKHTGLNF